MSVEFPGFEFFRMNFVNLPQAVQDSVKKVDPATQTAAQAPPTVSQPVVLDESKLKPLLLDTGRESMLQVFTLDFALLNQDQKEKVVNYLNEVDAPDRRFSASQTAGEMRETVEAMIVGKLATLQAEQIRSVKQTHFEVTVLHSIARKCEGSTLYPPEVEKGFKIFPVAQAESEQIMKIFEVNQDPNITAQSLLKISWSWIGEHYAFNRKAYDLQAAFENITPAERPVSMLHAMGRVVNQFSRFQTSFKYFNLLDGALFQTAQLDETTTKQHFADMLQDPAKREVLIAEQKRTIEANKGWPKINELNIVDNLARLREIANSENEFLILLHPDKTALLNQIKGELDSWHADPAVTVMVELFGELIPFDDSFVGVFVHFYSGDIEEAARSST